MKSLKTNKTDALLNPLNNRPANSGQNTAFFALLGSNKSSVGPARAARPALLKVRPSAFFRR